MEFGLKRWMLALGLVAVVTAACGGGGEQPEAGPTTIPISQECRQAFQSVQLDPPAVRDTGTPPEGSTRAPASPVPTIPPGAISDLLPTIPACDSVTEWTEALAAFPAEVALPLNPIDVLRNLCRHADDPEITEGELCRNVAQEPISGQQPGTGP